MTIPEIYDNNILSQLAKDKETFKYNLIDEEGRNIREPIKYDN